MSSLGARSYSHLRSLSFGLLLLTLPACGLSNYEELMRGAKQNVERFRNEQKYLDEPLQMPVQKDEAGQAKPPLNVFFRPPKGISPKPNTGPYEGRMWQYPARTRGEFVRVDLAFAAPEDNDFATEVVQKYQAEQNFPAPPRDASMPFSTLEFNDAQYGYSLNISKGGGPPVAIVFVFGKSKQTALRTAMDLSLKSLAVGQQVILARQKYNKKSPWNLTLGR